MPTNFTIAILAYEMLVPTSVILALQEYGTRTMATLERPFAPYTRSVPIIVDDLVVPAGTFIREIRESPMASALHLLPLGMWRSDLIVNARKSSRARSGSNRTGKDLILCLPYEVPQTADASRGVIVNSWEAHEHFIRSVCALALLHPDKEFVIRSKSDKWLALREFFPLRDYVVSLPNLKVDQDYSQLGRSYELASDARLIVGKYTSLMDEALSCGVPVVIHDFTPNATRLAAPVVPYLPAQAWAFTEGEFQEKASLVLNQPNSGPAWTSEAAGGLFEGLSDGFVRKRLRGFALNSLGERGKAGG